MKKTALAYLPFYLFITPFLLCAQSSASFSIEKILSAPFPSLLTAAPGGNQLAWIQNAEGVRNIWIASGPDYQGRALTNYTEDDGQEISNLTFSPNGLIYVRGGAPNRSGEIPNPASRPNGAQRQIWTVSLKGGEPRLLTEGGSPSISPAGEHIVFLKSGQVWRIGLEEDAKASQLFKIRGAASSLQWSPDKEKPKLAFISNRGDHAFLGIYDLSTQELRYLAPSVDQDANPVWSPQGDQIAFMRFPNEKAPLPFAARRSALPWSILITNLVSGKTKTVWTAKEGPGSAYRFISAPAQLFWGADNQLVFPYEGDGWTHLWTVSSQGGSIRCLTPGDFEVQFAALSTDGQNMIYSSNQNDIDRQHLWRVKISGGAPKQLTSGKGVEWSPVQTAEGRLACIASEGRKPARAMLLDASGQTIPLAPKSTPEDFPEKELVEPEQIVFSAADGMSIHGQLFLPENIKPGEKRPAILFFHGGSRRQMLLGFHHRGYYHNAYAMNQYLAAQGYIVLSVNYRSGIGYGMAFREALNYGAQGASEFNDVLGAGLYLQNRADVDPKRIGLWGGSYGGYLTALGLARASDLFAAGVDIHGVHDWNVVIRNFVPSYQSGDREAFARLAFESSPMSSMSSWRSPVLLIHGDDDRNVPFSETVDVAESLRRQGVYFEQLIFPDEVHGFLLHRNWTAAYQATADFFNRMLNGKAADGRR